MGECFLLLQLDQVQSMLAEYVRAGTESVSLLARAHDLRYKAVVSYLTFMLL